MMKFSREMSLISALQPQVYKQVDPVANLRYLLKESVCKLMSNTVVCLLLHNLRRNPALSAII
jgi:hypothetical protein